MYAEKDYKDQFIVIDNLPVGVLTKDQIYYLLEVHDDDGRWLNRHSVPCPYQCSKGSKLEKLLSEEELDKWNKYSYAKIGLNWDNIKKRRNS